MGAIYNSLLVNKRTRVFSFHDYFFNLKKKLLEEEKVEGNLLSS
jgi:hypothetical protein